MLEKNIEKIEFILLDWKGLKAHKEIVKQLLEKINISFKKIQEF